MTTSHESVDRVPRTQSVKSPIIWHADIVREVERSLRLLGASEAEIAALNTRELQAMYDAIQRAGGKSDILRILGSYRDTLPDEEVFSPCGDGMLNFTHREGWAGARRLLPRESSAPSHGEACPRL